MESLVEALERTKAKAEKVGELLQRFEANLVSGVLIEALGELEDEMKRLASIYPPAVHYHERVYLLRRYVEAIRVRAILYGLRNYFREVEYIESHYREIMSFLDNLGALLGASRRSGLSGHESLGKSHAHPEV